MHVVCYDDNCMNCSALTLRLVGVRDNFRVFNEVTDSNKAVKCEIDNSLGFEPDWLTTFMNYLI